MTLVEYTIGLVWLTGFAGYAYFIYVEVLRSADFKIPNIFVEFFDEFISVWSEVFQTLARAAGFTIEQTREIPQKVLNAVRTFKSNDHTNNQEIVCADLEPEDMVEFVPIDADETLERLQQHVIKSQFLLLKGIVEVLKVQPDQIKHLEIGHITISIISSIYLKYGLRGKDESAELLQKLVFNNLKEGQKRGFNITRAAVEYDKRKAQYSEQFEKILHNPATSTLDFDSISKILASNIFKGSTDHNSKFIEKEFANLIMRYIEQHKEFVRNELIVPKVIPEAAI